MQAVTDFSNGAGGGGRVVRTLSSHALSTATKSGLQLEWIQCILNAKLCPKRRPKVHRFVSILVLEFLRYDTSSITVTHVARDLIRPHRSCALYRLRQLRSGRRFLFHTGPQEFVNIHARSNLHGIAAIDSAMYGIVLYRARHLYCTGPHCRRI